MREQFERAFGLKDNPFNPAEFEGVPQRVLDGLSADALPVDEEPALLPLFVGGAGPFEDGLANYRRVLGLGGYEPANGGSGKLGDGSYFFRIVGPEGSGKSTLTNVMIEWLKRCGADGGLWVSKTAFRHGIEPAEVTDKTLTEAIGEGSKCCCIAFDDVTSTTEIELHRLWEELRRRRLAVVLFAIMHHADDVRRQDFSGRILVRQVMTTGLTASNAADFIRSRVTLFRADCARDQLIGELEMFPFDGDDVAHAVAPASSGPDADEPGPITLRVLSKMLHLGLEDALDGNCAAVSSLTHNELLGRRIKLADLFLRVRNAT